MVRGVRGAITCDNNEREEILSRTKELLTEILERNQISGENISAIFFSATSDLNKAFPAEAAREMGLTRVPLLDTQEMEVEGAMKRVIRILLLFETDKSQDEIKHVYLRGAASLRSDLS